MGFARGAASLHELLFKISAADNDHRHYKQDAPLCHIPPGLGVVNFKCIAHCQEVQKIF